MNTLGKNYLNRDYLHLVLVTGGHGFIGSHIAHELIEQGINVRIVDLNPAPPLLQGRVYDFVQGNLCDSLTCQRAMHNVSSVLHFAANMGGMGTIHEENDLVVYVQNHLMSLNLLSACIHGGVKRFFYASSACVYPDSLQEDPSKDASLRESDTWIGLSGAPKPQGLYGLEKLNMELLLLQLSESSRLDIRLARFHNVYGPGGAWNNGREKAPAAFLRKAHALKQSKDKHMTFEIWGDGLQRRSFLWIGDAVDAVLRLFYSETEKGPVNIGSEAAVSIQELAELALNVYKIDGTRVMFNYLHEKPVGVASRNSDNTRICSALDWNPTTSMVEGMKQTGEWIEKEIQNMLVSSDRSAHQNIIEDLKQSKILRLGADRITFAILLPVTSRGMDDPAACLRNLSNFAASFVKTTWRDTQSVGRARFQAKIYLAIDYDDEYLLSPANNYISRTGARAEEVLRQAGLADIVIIRCYHPSGHICSIWRQCAKQAWEDKCDYFVLLGDDIVLRDEGWMRDIHAEFQRFSTSQHVPLGFGCAAFTDLSFPGMPTFPVIHRTHLDIYQGTVVPEIFLNQDGDPFLFQLYRRWGCSSMLQCSLTNGIGGSNNTRYAKQCAIDWTFETLDNAVTEASQWLTSKHSDARMKLTLDVVIPSYRVDLTLIEGILSLKPPDTCSTMFIIIIDNPNSTDAYVLERRYGQRPDIRIRRNEKNIGASGSRNRGMDESSADWIAYLDDDVVPRPDLLIEAERVIREHPTAAGFVGNTQFPPSDTIFTTAVRFSGLTFFWDIATKISDDVPWGVSANLIARRNVRDGVRYSPIYPKTGGGEDIEFCRDKRAYSLIRGGKGFMGAPEVVVTHPWWNNGARSYRRFYMWSHGDGALVKRFLGLTYLDVFFNSAELLFLSILSLFILPFFLPLPAAFLISTKFMASVVMANIIHDLYRHLWKDAEHHQEMNTTLSGPKYVAAVFESALIRMASEMGRLHGMIYRCELSMIGRRFDWFAGNWADKPKAEEKKNNAQRAVLTFAVFCYVLSI